MSSQPRPTGPFLPSILQNTQNPHQPFLIIQDSLAASGLPVYEKLLGDAIRSSNPVVSIHALHPPSSLHLPSSSKPNSLQTLDLTFSIPSFSLPNSNPSTIPEIREWILQAIARAGRGVQVFIDAVDVLVEDYGGEREGLGMVREVLKAVVGIKAPSRLHLLLPAQSNLLPSLLSPTLSPSLTYLTLHSPSLIHHLSNTYLLSPPADGDLSSGTAGLKFRGVLETACGRGVGLDLGLRGEGGAGVAEWWETGRLAPPSVTGSTSTASSSSTGSGLVVEVLVRKTVGGASKGMLRSLEGVRTTSSPTFKGKERAVDSVELEACGWGEVPGMEGLRRGVVVSNIQVEKKGEENREAEKGEKAKGKEKDKAGHDTTFNLELTEEQKARRAEVPLPYAHEGDETPSTQRHDTLHTGPGIIFEPGSEDDVDDDDPDDDLDF